MTPHEARCRNCNRRHFPDDLNDKGICPDCAQFGHETRRVQGVY